MQKCASTQYLPIGELKCKSILIIMIEVDVVVDDGSFCIYAFCDEYKMDSLIIGNSIADY